MPKRKNTPPKPARHSNGEREQTANPFTILIVEDSSLQALKLKLALENNGYQVHWAETGLGGLKMVRQNHLDLIILDIELPDTSGFEICRKLKTDSKLAHIPVIMLTTLDHAEDVMSGFEVGAIDYIPKDAFAEAVLLETIKQMDYERASKA